MVINQHGSDQTPTEGLWSALDAITIISVVLGYLIAVTFRPQLTLSGFVAITVLHGLWFGLYRRLVQCRYRRAMPTMLGIGLASVGVAWTVNLHVGYDWVLPVIACGIFTSLLPWRTTLFPVAITFLGSLAALAYPFNGALLDVAFWQNSFSLVLAFVFSVAFCTVMRDNTLARSRMQGLLHQLAASRDELQEAHAQLRHYTDQVEELTVTRERNRMAREIHDTLGHYLTILALKLETATHLEERRDNRLHAELVEARRVAAECLSEVRHSVAALRPTDLALGTLDQALQRLAEDFTAACPEITVTTDLEGQLAGLAPEFRLALYRAVQEALTNIRKHAHATRVLLRLRVNADLAELTVLDNGLGSQATATTPGFGLTGMRERLALLDGVANAGPVPGRGWRVEVTLPLRQQPVAPRQPVSVVAQ